MNASARLSNFITKATSMHGEKYDYTLVSTTFKNAKTPVDIICKQHGIFKQTPDQHVRTYNTNKHANTGGCPQCANDSRKLTKRKDIQTFINQANLVHNHKYTYDKVVYISAHTKVLITCLEHGDFSMCPTDHLTGKQGCRLCCYRKHHSGKAVRWLEQIEKQHSIVLQRIGRGKEFRIPNTRYHVDGYDEQTNTIYEFYGNRFHGNLNMFSEHENCHPFNRDVTAGELYSKTIAREAELREMGYNVVSIWESEYHDDASIKDRIFEQTRTD